MSRKAEVEAAVEDVDFDKNSYQIDLKTTAGTISLALDPTNAPGHCRNMIGLAKIGFYDGLIFHRVIKGFMIQGGCPEGTGTGNPGYSVDAEFNSTLHEPGVLSMARSQDPDSAGSQFFVCLESVASLDGQYTAFGKAVDEASLDVVRAIGDTATNPQDRPLEDVKIETATVSQSEK